MSKKVDLSPKQKYWYFINIQLTKSSKMFTKKSIQSPIYIQLKKHSIPKKLILKYSTLNTISNNHAQTPHSCLQLIFIANFQFIL